MHVIISGYFGFDNEGDEAILQSIIDELRLIDPAIKLTVLSHNPDQTKEKYGVDAVNRWKIQHVIKVLKKSNGLISGGGSLLQDKTGMKSIPYYTGIIHLAKLFNKPVFVYAQGMGPINHTFSQALTRLALNRQLKLTVRDEGSKQLLEQIGVTSPITEVPDAVFGLKQALEPSAWLDELQLQQFIAVSVRAWPNTNAFFDQLSSVLDHLYQAGYAIVFIPMHGVKDEDQAKALAKTMTAPVCHVPTHTSLNEKLAILSKADVLLGMRLHALIFSSIVDTPFGAFSYDPKIDALAKKIKQPILTSVEDHNQQDLLSKTLHFIERKDHYKSLLSTEVKQLKQAADDTASQAISYFKNN